MTPTPCHVKHDPPNTYGDCLRACIATLLDLDTARVPHFAHDGPTDDAVVLTRLRVFLRGRGLLPFSATYGGTMDEVLNLMATVNRDVTYLLFNSGHVVVCCNDEVLHDPAWVPVKMDGSVWSVMVLVVV